MRTNRPKHTELEPLAKMKANARSYANTYQNRGWLEPQPCESCGSVDVQKHHTDYSKPLDIEWLCAPCHQAHHKMSIVEHHGRASQ